MDDADRRQRDTRQQNFLHRIAPSCCYQLPPALLLLLSLGRCFVFGLRKIDTAWPAVSLKKHIRNHLIAGRCTHSRQFCHDVLKAAAEIAAFRRKGPIHGNRFPEHVSFSSYRARRSALCACKPTGSAGRRYFFAMEVAGNPDRTYMPGLAKLRQWGVFAPDEGMMGTHAKPANGAGERRESADLGFLPGILVGQCRSLIESYHDVHGFGCLPDVLWKSGLGPFIQKHDELGQYLRKASTTRSAKKANRGFVEIATAILSLEILASSFAGWGAIYPEAAEVARKMLGRTANRPPMPLMEFYLYPPRHISLAAIATLVPPPGHQPQQAELYYRMAKPELSGEKQALHHLNSMRKSDGRQLATLPPTLA